MDELKKLVKLVSTRGLKILPLLDLSGVKSSKEKKLFDLIDSGKCESENQASEFLYQAPADDPRYKMLKMRIKRKLLSHLYFLDFSNDKFKVSIKYELECVKLLHQARILIKSGEYFIAEKLLNQGLKLAKEGEFTSLEVNCLELLFLTFSETANFKKFTDAKNLLAERRRILFYEQEAEEIYLTVKLSLNKSISFRKDYLPTVQKDLNRLNELWELSQSFNVYNYFYLLNIWYHELQGDFHKIISIATESEQLLAEKSLNGKRFDHRLNKYINVYAHLRAKSFSNGLVLAEMYQNDFAKTTVNWFSFMENYFLLAMHSGDYKLAQQVYKEVVQNEFFKKINKLGHERWTIFRTYLYFVNPDPELLKEFSFRDFLSSVPEFGKDKQGFNVAILIIQLMHYLREQDFEALNYRIGSLRKYMGTHLKESFSDRSRLFFKLLLLTVKEELDGEQCRKKGKAIYDKLQATPPPGDAYAEIEIIPYEHLWELALQMMEKKNKKFFSIS